jgi:phage-related protein
MVGSARPLRPLHWMSSSRDDLREFPDKVRDAFGFALYQAQGGERPAGAKSLKGLGGGVVELVSDFAGDAYRAVYTVRFEYAVYVLHAFKKKAKHGVKTPTAEIDLVRRRLRAAEEDYRSRFGKEAG